jgi:Molydopterin dinucleotide binding domain
MIAVELARHLGGDLGAGSLEELWAEIESVSALHRGVSKALHESLSGRDGVVVPLGRDAGARGHHEALEPLDPMADPGIASADTHPVPPSAGIALVSTPDAGPSAEAGSTSQLTPPSRVQLGQPARARKPDAAATTETAGGTAGNERTLRLVVSRPMWDGGALVQRSPSLASLHPPLELRVNPDDLARFGMKPATQVRVSSQRGSVVVTAMPDASIPTGIAVLPFNLPGGGAGELIDASAPHTDVRLGHAEGL